jgi:hypothetical protein
MKGKNAGEGPAKVGDVLIKGMPNDPISDVNVVITLAEGIAFENVMTADVALWFDYVPSGLNIAVENLSEDNRILTLTVSGETTHWETAALAITIPGDYNDSLDDITVTTNPEARYDIAMPIGNKADFVAFVNEVNTNGKVTLSAVLASGLEIDATTGVDFPIARDYHNSYQGEFNGSGGTIDIALEGSGSYLAMFGVNNGYIHDFKVTGWVKLVEGTAPADYAAVVVAYNDIKGIIEKVVNLANLTAEPDIGQSNIAHNVAGITGFNGWDHYNSDSPHAEDEEDYEPGGTVSQCRNEGAITGGFNKIGGIAGENAYIIKECANLGAITCDKAASDRGWPGVGGIVGRNGNNNEATEMGQILACYNQGRINDNAATGAGQNAYGGITGWCDTVSNVENCYTTGLIYQKDALAKSGNVNPIIGMVDSDPDNTDNNYALKDIYASSPTDEKLAGIPKESADMKTEDFVNLLNGGTTGPYVPVVDDDGLPDYPKLAWEVAQNKDKK